MDKVKAKNFQLRASEAFASFEDSRAALGRYQELLRLKKEWSALLSEYRKCIKFLEQAARNIDRNPWADALHNERKNSDTLTYLFHARNVDEHGAVAPAGIEPASLRIGDFISFSGNCQNITMTNNVEIVRLPDGSEVRRTIDGQLNVSDGRITDGYLETDAPVSRVATHLKLTRIIDRGTMYDLPSLDVPADKLAEELAKRCFVWLDKKSRELSSFVNRP